MIKKILPVLVTGLFITQTVQAGFLTKPRLAKHHQQLAKRKVGRQPYDFTDFSGHWQGECTTTRNGEVTTKQETIEIIQQFDSISTFEGHMQQINTQEINSWVSLQSTSTETIALSWNEDKTVLLTDYSMVDKSTNSSSSYLRPYFYNGRGQLKIVNGELLASSSSQTLSPKGDEDEQSTMSCSYKKLDK